MCKYGWTCLEYLAAFSYFPVFVTKYFALRLSPRQQVNKATRIKNSALNPWFGNMHVTPAAQLKLSKWLMLKQ